MLGIRANTLMKGPPADLVVLNVANALQVTVLAETHEGSDDAFQRFVQIAKDIPLDLDQPHLAVLRSLLVSHAARWSDNVAPHAHELVFRGLYQLLTAPCERLAGLYLDIMAIVRAARDAAAGPRASSTQAQVIAALEYVRTHYTDHPLRLGDVARAVHVSRWHLGRLIRRDTGECFTRHVRNVRLDAACRLLVWPGLSIKEVAYRAGYPHVSQFTRDFKGLFDVAPREWRRRQAQAA